LDAAPNTSAYTSPWWAKLPPITCFAALLSTHKELICDFRLFGKEQKG
jgi:hypothetical protein